ncbi:MAG TPA: DJ-1 family glyoxalase III [Polyangiaceae bacterium]
MTKALVILADGCEELEAITVVDVLRRANVEVTAAARTEKRVTGAHGIVIEADTVLEEIVASSTYQSAEPFDVVVLPGGMPGARHLRDDARVRALLVEQVAAGRWVAAICAGPIALEAAGILGGRRATSYPGHALPSSRYVEERVVVDGNIVTSRGPGTALEFALTLVERLVGAAKSQQLRNDMLVI